MQIIKKLTKWDLMERWTASKRTVERHAKKFGLKPVDWTGREPVFDVEAVERMEARRRAHLLKVYGYDQPASVITVKEAKARASKGGGR